MIPVNLLQLAQVKDPIVRAALEELQRNSHVNDIPDIGAFGLQLIAAPTLGAAIGLLFPGGAADEVAYFTGPTTTAFTAFTVAGRTLAGLGTAAADQFAYFTGVNTAAYTALTSFSRTLLADSTAAAWLATLGIPGAWGNTRIVKTANYTVTAADNGGTFALSGGFFTLTFPSIASVNANQINVVVNEDTGTLAAKLISLSSGGSFLLWPGQTAIVYADGTVWRVLAPDRWVLPSATTFYVSTSGNDSNDGLSSSRPWATFAHAMLVLTALLDFGGQTVTLQILDTGAATTYNAANGNPQLKLLPWVGGGALVVQGNVADQDRVVISSVDLDAINSIVAPLPGSVTVRFLKVTTSGNVIFPNFCSGINAGATCLIIVDNVDFGACSFAHMLAQSGGIITNSALDGTNKSFTVSGNAGQGNAYASGMGRVTIFGQAHVAIPNAITVGTGWAIGAAGGNTTYGFGMTFTGAGGAGAPATVTGPKFSCSSGTITTGRPIDYLPGTQAGVGANSGATLYT